MQLLFLCLSGNCANNAAGTSATMHQQTDREFTVQLFSPWQSGQMLSSILSFIKVEVRLKALKMIITLLLLQMNLAYGKQKTTRRSFYQCLITELIIQL